MRYRPVRWDLGIAALCYVCALLLCVSPLVPYEFQTTTQLYAGTLILGTPLAAIGIWLNHRASKDEAPKT